MLGKERNFRFIVVESVTSQKVSKGTNVLCTQTVIVLSSDDGSRGVGNTALTILVCSEEQDACNTSDLWEAKLWS